MSDAPHVLVLDMGTSSLRALVFDAHARPVKGLEARRTYHTQVTDDGGSTLDPEEMWDALCAVLDEINAACAGRVQIAAVATSSLAYNVLGLDDQDQPLTPAFLYSDTRNAAAVKQLAREHDWRPIYARTGCPPHTGYLAGRFRWLAETQPEAWRAAARWVSLHEFFLRRLFGRAALSPSFASWSGMLNQAMVDWDGELLEIAGVRRAQLSPIAAIAPGMQGLRGEFATRWRALADAPWFLAVGDGAVANLGSGCTDATRVAVTVGTSGAMRVVLPAAQGLNVLPQGLWLYRVDERDGLLGGSLNNGGNVFAYFAQFLSMPDREEVERQVRAIAPDGHGLTMLPFFAGERSPGYRADARAAITGWSLGTTPADMWRAALEAISYRFAAIFDLLRQVVPTPAEVIASGGGFNHSRAWVQILADVLGVPVTASGEDEASARGAALLALLALGAIPTLEALPAARADTYIPQAAHFEIYAAARERQKKLYHTLLDNES